MPDASNKDLPIDRLASSRADDRPRPGHRDGIWPLVSAAEMQALDKQTIEGRDVAGEILMESAGRALTQPTLRLLATSGRSERPVRALCGAGNNGGDGFVLVRHLLAEGVAAEAILLGDPLRLPRDAAANWRRLEKAAVPRRVVDPERDRVDWAALLDGTSVAIDALFGTGLQREIGGGRAALIESVIAAREHGLRVIAVDIPSGIAANTGQVLGCAIRADCTVTISLPKIGLALEPGRSHAGEITVARVGIDDPDPARLPRVELWNALAAARRFPARPRAGHKGSFGHVLLAAGAPGKMGAAALSARAAARAGAGLVTLAHPAGLSSELSGLCAEVMTEEVAATERGGLAAASEKAIEELAASREVLALGPGVGRERETIDLVRRLVARVSTPLVVDADGLFGLQGRLDLLYDREAPTILTPHPGEAARLLDCEARQLNSDRVGSARALATASGSVVVLKGAGTVVADPDGRTLIVPTGGPLLASGGTGDVLTGVTAALLAAGMPAFEAAGLAAWWHGATADRSDRKAVGFGLLAGELADALPDAAAEICRSLSREELDAALDLRFPGP